MISQTAEYALRAIVFLGHQAGDPCTTAQLAAAIEAPPRYVAKVMQGLTRVGIVVSERELHGGFMLNRDPSDLTVLDVICAVDAFHRIPRCPLGKPAHTSGLCPLHRRLDNVMAATESSREQMTIGTLLEESGLLCTLPCVSEPAQRFERGVSV